VKYAATRDENTNSNIQKFTVKHKETK